MRTISLLLLVLFFGNIYGQETAENQWSKKLSKYKIKPIVAFQLWSTYSSGMEVFNAETQTYEAVDNRLNTQIRRIRAGVQGQPYRNLKFQINAALDFVGRDVLNATEGGANNGPSPAFRIWNAYLQWKLKDKNDGIHLTIGYIPPQIGRASITAALRVPSMEKSWSQNYLRRHLVGIGPGRAAGINLGGLFLNANKKFGFSYDAGIFNPVSITNNSNSTGGEFSALLVGRAVFHIGDPEFERYTIGHKVNYFGKRNGVSIALAGAYQGQTDLYEENTVLGFDLLFNWKFLSIDGEFSRLNRMAGADEIDSYTGYIRAAYTFKLNSNRYWEIAFMHMQFAGSDDERKLGTIKRLKAFAGRDHTYDIGLNYYFNPNVKLSLHYTFKDADNGFEPGSTYNNYLFQGGVGAIRRGDWLGAGLAAIF